MFGAETLSLKISMRCVIMQNEQKTILVTGASRGIGAETALALSAKDGIRVLALSRNTEKLAQLCSRALKEHHKANIIALEFDLETGNLAELAEHLRSTYGHLDGLINNAASIVVKPFAELEADDFYRVFGLNVFRTAMLIKNLLPMLRREGPRKTHIVNISSMGGFQGSAKFAGLSAYSSSKAALCGLTECLAEELKDQHIAVNCLCLGAVQTEMLAEAFPGYIAPVSPKEMGAYIAGFALTGAGYFNGKSIPVSLSTP